MAFTAPTERKVKNASDRIRRHRARQVEIDLPLFDRPSRRRKACANDLLRFIKTYLAHRFTLPMSDDHLKGLERISTAILTGGLYATACPRGDGKTERAIASVLWATLYSHRRFVVVIAADMASAKNMLSELFRELSDNDKLAEDWPHICAPFRQVMATPNRARFLTYNGKPIRIQARTTLLAFPGINGSTEIATGNLIAARGLTGGLRGMRVTTPDGKTLRPDMAVIDDPQTDESAHSPEQVKTREALLNGAIMGLAGPNKKLSAVCNATIISRGDLADRLLDPKLHPEWRGLKTQMVYEWPESDQTLWKQYAELRQHGNAEGDKGKAANEFYKTNRQTMDKGGRVGWEHRIRPGEISAMQTAYNIKIDHGDSTFAAEYQNEPLSNIGSQYELTVPMILAHAVNIPRLHLPPLTTVFVGSLDINRVGIHYCLAGFDQAMTGHTPLYAKHPQHGDLWAKNAPELDRKRAIFGGLKTVCDHIAGTVFMRSTQRIQPSLILIDLGFEADVVHRFCNSFAYPFKVIPSAGRAAHKYYIKRDALISRPFEGCHVQKSDNGPYLIFSADLWRETMQRAFLADPGAPGGFTLFAAPEKYHVAFAEHVIAEKLANKYETEKGLRWEWVHAPGSQWDWSDALVGCWCAAAASGLSTSGISLPRRRPKQPRRQCQIPIAGEPPMSRMHARQVPGRRVSQVPIQNQIY